MANLFNNLFKGFFGQQDTPDLQGYNGTSIFQNLLANQDALANANVDYYQKVGLPGAGVTRQIENIYDPNAGNLRETTTSRILNDLALGNKLPSDVTRQVMQNSHENANGAGIGFSPAARSLTARDLGLTSLDVGNQRLNRAQSYTGQLSNQFSNFLNQTMGNSNNFFTPQSFANADLSGIDYGNRINETQTGIQNQNNAAMANTITKTIGRIVGGILSGGATEALQGGGGGGFGGGGGGGGLQDLLSRLLGTAPSSIQGQQVYLNG